MEQNEWAVINYTLPREPSRVRVSIWRKLKKLGAVNMQQSMWILPLSEESLTRFNELKNDICKNGGECFVMRSSMDEGGKNVVVERFHAARNEEYSELLEQCEDFFHEIDKETARQNFTFAEIEENEEELAKLKEWYEKIKKRDFFGAPLFLQSESALQKCEDLLEEFCSKVYDFNEKE